jgi:hypothetical protein
MNRSKSTTPWANHNIWNYHNYNNKKEWKK